MSSEPSGGDEEMGPRTPGYARQSSSLDAEDLRGYLLYGALVVCVLVALVATANFYGSASTAIDVWVSERYQPLYQAAFNLGMLLLAGIGITLVVRRL